jgi:hypothetical protein
LRLERLGGEGVESLQVGGKCSRKGAKALPDGSQDGAKKNPGAHVEALRKGEDH